MYWPAPGMDFPLARSCTAVSSTPRLLWQWENPLAMNIHSEDKEALFLVTWALQQGAEDLAPGRADFTIVR
jgi:hypothetical protein